VTTVEVELDDVASLGRDGVRAENIAARANGNGDDIGESAGSQSENGDSLDLNHFERML